MITANFAFCCLRLNFSISLHFSDNFLNHRMPTKKHFYLILHHFVIANTIKSHFFDKAAALVVSWKVDDKKTSALASFQRGQSWNERPTGELKILPHLTFPTENNCSSRARVHPQSNNHLWFSRVHTSAGMSLSICSTRNCSYQSTWTAFVWGKECCLEIYDAIAFFPLVCHLRACVFARSLSNEWKQKRNKILCWSNINVITIYVMCYFFLLCVAATLIWKVKKMKNEFNFFYRKLNDLMHFHLHEWVMKRRKSCERGTMDSKLDS